MIEANVYAFDTGFLSVTFYWYSVCNKDRKSIVSDQTSTARVVLFLGNSVCCLGKSFIDNYHMTSRLEVISGHAL